MKIYVIRHGFTKLNKARLINGHLDDELVEQGIEQARIAGPALPKTIKHIYCSPLGRTRQTAAILNESLNVPITYHDELKEVHFGSLEGQEFTKERLHSHQSQTYDWRPHGGENLEDVKKRMLKILREIYAANPGDGEALIVGHGGTIRTLHVLETGKILDEIQNTSLHSFDLTKIVERNK